MAILRDFDGSTRFQWALRQKLQPAPAKRLNRDVRLPESKMKFCEIHDMIIDPEYESCPICAMDIKEAKIVLCDFYSTVRDIAETADGYDTFEERVMVAIEETSRNLTSA